MWNASKTVLLLGSMTGLLLLIGGAVGGRQGMAVMLVLSAIMNIGSWFFSDTIVLKTTHAVPVPEGKLDWLRRDVEELAQRAGIPAPRLFVMPHEGSPNAFATGRSPSRGVVAVTAGLLDTLGQREVRGVLAHELGHIKNRDTLVSAVAATLAGVITFLAYSLRFVGFGHGGQDRRGANPLVLLLVSILAPIAALVIRMAISRTREYGADRRAAELTGDPEGLALALEDLSRGIRRQPMLQESARSVHFIVNGFTGGLGRLFSTHPPLEERVRKLRELAAEQP